MKKTTWVFFFYRYGKFWSIFPEQKVKLKPLFSEEWIWTWSRVQIWRTIKICRILFKNVFYNLIIVFVCFSKRYKEKYHDIYVTILPSMAQAEFDAIFVPLASSLFEWSELGFSDFMNWKSFSSSWWSFCCWYIFINFSYNSLGMHVVPVYSVGKKNWFIIIRKNGKYIEENIYHIYLHTFISSRFFGFHFIWNFFWSFNSFICGKIIREKLEHNNFESKSNI